LVVPENTATPVDPLHLPQLGGLIRQQGGEAHFVAVDLRQSVTDLHRLANGRERASAVTCIAEAKRQVVEARREVGAKRAGLSCTSRRRISTASRIAASAAAPSPASLRRSDRLLRRRALATSSVMLISNA
jgi:hypothetical protein